MLIMAEISSLSPPLDFPKGRGFKVAPALLFSWRTVILTRGTERKKNAWKEKIFRRIKKRLMRTVISASLNQQRRVLMQEIQVWWRRVKENSKRKRRLNNRLLCGKERAKRKDECGWFKRDVKRWQGRSSKVEERGWDRQWSYSQPAAMLLKGQPLCLQHPDWCGREWIMRLDYSPWDGTLFRINPPGNHRQHKQQPSASVRTVREAIVSEDNIIFVNDLLPPHVGAISTYSAPAGHSATHVKSLQFTCVRI